MKVLIITVAGMSTRFSESIGKECLKCIYYENKFEDTLLYKMIYRDLSFDKYVIVGGYKFDELKSVVDYYFKAIKDKIILVNNIKFAEYGSGYSLYLGLKNIIDDELDEVVFAEGDLWIDEKSFHSVVNSQKNVITFNGDTIEARKSVVFYFDCNNNVKYLYDTSHNRLEIKEPFLSIYNSGQIWKFSDNRHLKNVFYAIDKSDWQGTNLVFIQKYFGSLHKENYELIKFEKWLNCNVVSDYRKIGED